MTYKQAEFLLQEFSRTQRIDQLAFNSNGCCEIKLPGCEVTVHVNTAADTLIFYSMIGRVPQRLREAVATDLANANVFWQSTQGATLAMDNDNGMVFVARQDTLRELDAVGFESALLLFADVARDWTSRIERPELVPNVSDVPPRELGQLRV